MLKTIAKAARSVLPKLVVDISNVNDPDAAEWSAIKANPRIVGVICKATEGLAFLDKVYPAARRITAGLGRVFGCYLFLHADADGAAQAQEFLRYAKPKPGDIQPIIDAEEIGLRGKTVAEMAKQTDAAARTLDHAGYAPILYADTSFLTSLVAAAPTLKRLRVWQAEYGPTLHRVPGVSTLLWQFTSSAVVGKGRFDESRLVVRDLNALRIPQPNKATVSPKPLPGPAPKPPWFWAALKQFIANRKGQS